MKKKILSFGWQESYSFVAEGNHKILEVSLSSGRRINSSLPSLSKDFSSGQTVESYSAGASVEVEDGIYAIWRRGRDLNPGSQI